jgi:hypothetical protein
MVNLFKSSLATIEASLGRSHADAVKKGRKRKTRFGKGVKYKGIEIELREDAQEALLFVEEIVREEGKPETVVRHLSDGAKAEVRKLFESAASQAFDLDKLSDKPLVTILLDLMMYEDPDLFEAAFGLLYRRNAQKKKLMASMHDVVILKSEYLGASAVPDGDLSKLPALRAHVAHMRKEVNEWELWAQHNELGPIGAMGDRAAEEAARAEMVAHGHDAAHSGIEAHVARGLHEIELFCFKYADDGASSTWGVSSSDVGKYNVGDPFTHHTGQTGTVVEVTADDGSEPPMGAGFISVVRSVQQAGDSDEDESKAGGDHGPSIKSDWHGLSPLPTNQTLLRDLNAHEIFLKALAIPWQRTYEHEVHEAELEAAREQKELALKQALDSPDYNRPKGKGPSKKASDKVQQARHERDEVGIPGNVLAGLSSEDVRKNKASRGGQMAAGSPVSGGLGSEQILENAERTKAILLGLVLQALAGLTAMIRGSREALDQVTEHESAQTKHNQELLFNYLPEFQRELSHGVEAHERAMNSALRALQSQGTSSAPLGSGAPFGSSLKVQAPSTAGREDAASLLRPGSIIAGCNALLTELFRRNDELAEQCPEQLFATFAALLNAAGGRDPETAQRFLAFFEATVVQENGEPQRRNQGASLLALTDTRFVHIIPRFTAIRDVAALCKPPLFVPSIEYRAGLLRLFAACARGDNTKTGGQLQALLPSKGLRLPALLAFVDTLLTELVPGLQDAGFTPYGVGHSDNKDVFNFTMPFNSWRAEALAQPMHRNAKSGGSARNFSPTPEDDGNDAKSAAQLQRDEDEDSMEPSVKEARDAAAEMAKFARSAAAGMEGKAALWQLLGAATELIEHVFCDTILVDFTFAQHDVMWGHHASDGPGGPSSMALVPKLAHLMVVLSGSFKGVQQRRGRDAHPENGWWPRDFGGGLGGARGLGDIGVAEVDGLFMAAQEREACCGYMLRSGLPMLLQFFTNIYQDGGVAGGSRIGREKNRLLKAVKHLAEQKMLDDLIVETGVGGAPGEDDAADRRALRKRFARADAREKAHRIKNSAMTLARTAFKLVLLLDDGKGAVDSKWRAERQSELRTQQASSRGASRRSSGFRTGGMGHTTAERTTAIAENKKKAVITASQKPADYFEYFVEVACKRGNWLSAGADADFDSFVKQVATVEQRTSGEQGAGVPVPQSQATLGLSLGQLNKLRKQAGAAAAAAAAGAASGMAALGAGADTEMDRELDALIRQLEEPMAWQVHEANAEAAAHAAMGGGTPAAAIKAAAASAKSGASIAASTAKSSASKLKSGGKAAAHGDDDDWHGPCQVLMRRVPLSSLVRRIARHVTSQLLEPENAHSLEEECVLFDLLRRVVGRWRSRNATNLAFSEEERGIMFERRQNDLNDWGCTDLVVTAMGAEGLEAVHHGREVFDRALHFGRVLLEKGNSNVQAKLHACLSRGDAAAEGFFRHLVHRVRTETSNLERIREQDALGDGLGGGGFDAEMEDDDDEEDGLGGGHAASSAAIISIFQFLQLCCEGHNHEMQTIVRRQEHSTKTFDLVQEAIQLLCSECKSKKSLTRMRRPELEVVVQLLDFLTESMEGPCPDNQAAVAASGVPDVVMRIMGGSFRLEEDDNEAEGEHGGHALVGSLRASTMTLVSAMLEGRSGDRAVHDTLLDKLGASTIKNSFVNAHSRMVEIDKLVQRNAGWFGAGSFCNLVMCRGGLAQRRNATLFEERDDRINEMFELFSSSSTLSAERPELALALMPDGGAGDGGAGGGGSGAGGDGGRKGGGGGSKASKERKYAVAHAYLEQRFSRIEVAWNGAVHRVYFQMPETERLAEVRKRQLLEAVDLGAGRLAEFVDRASDLSDEMNHLMTQSESGATLFFKRYYFTFKYVLYFFVVCLNLTLLSVTKAPPKPAAADARLYGDTLQCTGPRSGAQGSQCPAAAKYVINALICVVALGYLAILVYTLVSRAPLVTLSMKRRRDARLAAELRKSGGESGADSGDQNKDNDEAVAKEKEEEEHRAAVLTARRQRGPHAMLLGYLGDRVATWGDWGAFRGFWVAAICYCIIGIGLLGLLYDPSATQSIFAPAMNASNANHWQISWYLWLGAVVFGQWLLRCLRLFWADRTMGLTAMYCVVWDVLTDHNACVHSALLAFTAAAYWQYYFAALLLLDIVNFNETLANVVRAATRPYRALLMTLLLFLIGASSCCCSELRVVLSLLVVAHAPFPPRS